MRHLTLTIALGLCSLGALLSPHRDARASESFQTCPDTVPPSSTWGSLDVGNNDLVGFGQSFEIPFSGRLDAIALDTHQVPNDPIELLWTLNLVEADGTVGTELASGELEYPGYASGYASLEFSFSNVWVEAGQTLFFSLKRQPTSTGSAGLRWLYGSATDQAPYPGGTAYSGSSNGVWTPVTTQGDNLDLRLTAYATPCLGAATDPVITIDPILADTGADYVTLSGTAADPDRIKEIWLAGDATPIASWTTANASTSPTLSLPIPASGGPAPEVISGHVVDFCGHSTPFQTTVSYGLCTAESPVCAADALGYVFYIDVVPATDGCVIRCQTDAQGQNLQCALQCGM